MRVRLANRGKMLRQFVDQTRVFDLNRMLTYLQEAMNEQLYTLEIALRKLTRRLAEIESTGKMTGEEGVRTQRALHNLLLENEDLLRRASEIFNGMSESDRLRLCEEHQLNASLIESKNAVAATLSVLDDAHRKTWGTELEPLFYFDTHAVVMLPRYVSFAKYAA